MALNDKDIVITPNKGAAGNPSIVLTDENNTSISVTLTSSNGGTLTFAGGIGALLNLINTSVGTLFGVNDASGIPSLEVLDDGTVRLAQYGGNVGVGTGSPAYKLDVVGTVRSTALTSTTINTGSVTFANGTTQTTKGFTTVNIQVLTSGTVYTPTTNMVTCQVYATGAGGGGGGADNDGAGGGGGGGGGAGGTAVREYTAAQIGATATYAIGGAGTAGSLTNGTSGGVGGNTTFTPSGGGTALTATGGLGGTGTGVVAADSAVAGGAGGVPTGGEMNITGGGGGSGQGQDVLIMSFSGTGGASYWGGGGQGIAALAATNTTGIAGGAFGSGGSGAASRDSTTGASGGQGAAGIIFIIEFIAG